MRWSQKRLIFMRRLCLYSYMPSFKEWWINCPMSFIGEVVFYLYLGTIALVLQHFVHQWYSGQGGDKGISAWDICGPFTTAVTASGESPPQKEGSIQSVAPRSDWRLRWSVILCRQFCHPSASSTWHNSYAARQACSRIIRSKSQIPRVLLFSVPHPEERHRQTAHDFQFESIQCAFLGDNTAPLNGFSHSSSNDYSTWWLHGQSSPQDMFLHVLIHLEHQRYLHSSSREYTTSGRCSHLAFSWS